MSPAQQAKAACRTAGPDLFFGPDGGNAGERRRRVPQAQAVCLSCPVRIACLDAAKERRERWGVWGGTDFETAPMRQLLQTARPDVAASGRA